MSKLAFVFPGQGSQSVGMGKDFYDNTKIGKDLFDKADEILGYSISDLCFNGPLEELSKTINTQPALYIVSAIACDIAKEKGFVPSVCAGHSAGEYAALYSAGAFSFEDGLKLIAKRAKFMNEVAEGNPGGMAAILNLDIREIIKITEKVQGVCVAANINTPVQTVISGEKSAVEEAMKLCLEAGAKRALALNVSGAFHSPLMSDAAVKLGEILKDTPVNSLDIPVVANFTANVENNADKIKENLKNQITGSVRWVETCDKFKELEIGTCFELGSGNVLCGLIKKCTPDIECKKINLLADFE